MSWTLTGAIDEAIEAADSPDPDDIVRLVEIPSNQLRHVVTLLLRHAVVNQLRNGREPADADDVMPERPVRRSNKSKRLESVNDRFWMNPVYSPAAGEWKRLKDMTVADWQSVADDRRADAKAYEAQADKYDTIVVLMRRRGVATTGELDRDDLRGLL